MDGTHAAFANRCLPLLIANQWGWFILNDRRIDLKWNGGTAIPDLHIHYWEKVPEEKMEAEKLLAVSHFGHGILTFRIPYLFQTPPGWNLYVRGPANCCKDGICPLDGVVEADWCSATFTMNWKVTRPEMWITFDEGEPISQIFPVERGSLERFEPEILALSQNPEFARKHREWARSRTEFNAALRKGDTEELWQKHYFRGTSADGQAFLDHQTKLALREYRDVRNPSQRAVPGCAETPTSAPPVRPVCRAGALSAFVEDLRSPEGGAPATVQGTTIARPDHPKDPSHEGTAISSPMAAPLASAGVERPSVPPVDFQVVVSSENNPFMAWQTQLFCFSAITRLKKRPTVIVHGANRPLRPEFSAVKIWGCRLIEAPQFRGHPKGEYAARNEPGSLLIVSALSEFRQGHILFCEPDMLFVRRPEYSGELAGEYYAYLDYKQERIRTAARKFGIEDRLEELNRTSQIGVPYLIPGPLLPRIARRWIEVLDAFEELDWIDIMYALGLALAVEGLQIRTTHLTADNYNPQKRLDRSIVHYCYGDGRWSKHAFQNGRTPLWPPPIRVPKDLSDTVLGEILRQIRQASGCARFPRAFSAFRRLARSLSR